MADLALLNLRKRYGSHVAVRDIDLSLNSGDFLTLLGPSGCGKTTTLKLIAGIEAPDAGSIRLGARDVSRVPVNRRGIGFVFQSLALFPHRTVTENVAFGLRMRGVPRRDIAERTTRALDLVRLSAHRDKLPQQLSGGQQQRVALARAFVIEPPVMLLDEPLSALDRNLREAMQVEIRDLTQRLGITSVFVTHDQAEAMALSDRIAVMNDGAIEQFGSPQEVFRRPATPFVAAFMGVSNLFPAMAEGDGRLRLDDFPDCAIEAAVPLSQGERVTVALRPEDACRCETDAGWALTVRRSIYQGTRASVWLGLPSAPAGSAEIEATLPIAGAPPATGETVHVTWPVDRVMIFPQDPGRKTRPAA
ncbi:ABC transporter ATP-binding protein [Acuticoccus sediminis]|uniref:ABC transporter ATP-binding protein n=1 Tax=Acuticoccus sediminis TaxID=2184697 RepID=A0A8B2NIH2_9HYPH|nr:ABC transporter ATP-binding protein [Acuticoccus sediminis]RAH97321.1 ABC transporter ATP-binding protein [Acuticoccus sediminis]